MTNFALDEKSDLPLWVQIRNRLVYLINSGELESGAQLPSVRSFAADLQISYNTVSKAYMALEREGFIETRRGSGAYVKAIDTLDHGEEINSMVDDFVNNCIAEGMDYEEIVPKVLNSIRRLQRGNND